VAAGYAAQGLPTAPLGWERAVELLPCGRCLHPRSSLAKSQGGSCTYRL